MTNPIMTLYSVLSVFILSISVLFLVSPSHPPSANKQVTQTSQCEEVEKLPGYTKIIENWKTTNFILMRIFLLTGKMSLLI